MLSLSICRLSFLYFGFKALKEFSKNVERYYSSVCDDSVNYAFFLAEVEGQEL